MSWTHRGRAAVVGVAVLGTALVSGGVTLAHGSAAPEPARSSAASDNPYPEWSVVNVGHRGLAEGFPENTLAAFENSIEIGVDVIEIDLRGTADGEVVILHDETVDRTTDGSGAVTEMTLEEVKALDAGSWYDPEFAGERIPTYEEVLDLVSGTGVKLLLDIKLSPVLDKERIVRLTERFGAELDVIAGVRSVDDLREFRALNPNLRTLGFIPDSGAIEEFHQAGIDIIRLWPDWITDSRDTPRCQADVKRRQHQYERGMIDDPGSKSCLVQRVHDLGLPVWATANDASREELDELVRLRVNGILTDLPLVLAGLLEDIEAGRE